MSHSSHDSPSLDPVAKINQSKNGLDSESRATVDWHFFDPQGDIELSARDRPHWDQCGALTFVTIRLADSMPIPVVQRWLKELQDWLKRHGVEASGLDSPSREQQPLTSLIDRLQREFPEPLCRAYTRFKNQRCHENLDNCYGSCLLRQPEHAIIVSDSLLKFDGHRYDLERFVIMPNHLHLLVQMRSGWGLRKQCESWTRFTGRQMNAVRKALGEVWSEPFDHIVRNPEQGEYLQ